MNILSIGMKSVRIATASEENVKMILILVTHSYEIATHWLELTCDRTECDIMLSICVSICYACSSACVWSQAREKKLDRNVCFEIVSQWESKPMQTMTWVNSLYWPTEPAVGLSEHQWFVLLSFHFINSLFFLSFCFCACYSPLYFSHI